MHFSDLSLNSAAVLFFAAVVGGVLNAVAGGGSFIAFPALLFSGVPPVPANATNAVALWTGLAFSSGAFRHHLKVDRQVLIILSGVSFAGGIAGAVLLLSTPAKTFLRILPWLMLMATLLFISGPRLTRQNETHIAHNRSAGAIAAAACVQVLIAVYGGYFGGGMGIMVLAMLSAFGMADIHEMNALKTVLSSATNGIVVLIFIVRHAVYWPEAIVMVCGAILGGYFGAHYSLRLPRVWIRCFVIAIGGGMTAYFFAHAYGAAP